MKYLILVVIIFVLSFCSGKVDEVSDSAIKESSTNAISWLGCSGNYSVDVITGKKFKFLRIGRDSEVVRDLLIGEFLNSSKIGVEWLYMKDNGFEISLSKGWDVHNDFYFECKSDTLFLTRALTKVPMDENPFKYNVTSSAEFEIGEVSIYNFEFSDYIQN